MSRKLVIAGALLLSGAVGLWLFHDRPHSKPRASRSEQADEVTAPQATLQPRPAVKVVAVPAAVREPEKQLDEPSLMARLRSLVQAAPLDAIGLAREGNARFPDSPDAPERAWIVAKSLAGLGRFHEAKDEAQAMVARYPDTPWTLDVERHLLVNPLDLPPREAESDVARAH